MTPWKNSRRFQREYKTLAAMIAMYCRHHHRERPLCSDCRELLASAEKRLSHCQHGEQKSTCARCPTHCYPPKMQERMREVMRFSGPGMLFRHPLLSLAHLLDSRKKVQTGTIRRTLKN